MIISVNREGCPTISLKQLEKLIKTIAIDLRIDNDEDVELQLNLSVSTKVGDIVTEQLKHIDDVYEVVEDDDITMSNEPAQDYYDEVIQRVSIKQ